MKDAVQEAANAGRKPAPIVTPVDTSGAFRKALVDKLDAENPEYVHSYQAPGVTDWELETKGQEIVKDEKGRVLHHRGDPVVRAKRSVFEAERQAEAERSLKSVVETDVLEEDVATRLANPKKPREVKKA